MAKYTVAELADIHARIEGRYVDPRDALFAAAKIRSEQMRNPNSPLMKRTDMDHEATLQRLTDLETIGHGTAPVDPLADNLARGDRILEERAHAGRHPLDLAQALNAETAKAKAAAAEIAPRRHTTLLTDDLA